VGAEDAWDIFVKDIGRVKFVADSKELKGKVASFV
jgi:hypothetical protein